jgi:hypothetical protein
MTEPQTSLIKSMNPQREWLIRCSDSGGNLAVCAIHVSNGRVEIESPEDEVFRLEDAQIADFRSALNAAIDLAEADLRHCEAEHATA